MGGIDEMEMQHSTKNAEFLERIKSWLPTHNEVLVMCCFSGGGTKEFRFFTTFESLKTYFDSLPADTSVTVFRDQQLPLRGQLDAKLAASAIDLISDGDEYLIARLEPTTYGRVSWYADRAGDNHTDLREDLEAFMGKSVAIGLYPPWEHDSDVVISAYVPRSDGSVVPGIY